HAGDIFTSILDKIRRRSEAAVTMITVHDDVFILVGVLYKLLHVTVVQTNRAGNMRLLVRAGITDIDEETWFLVKFALCVLDWSMRDLHAPALCHCRLI